MVSQLECATRSQPPESSCRTSHPTNGTKVDTPKLTSRKCRRRWFTTAVSTRLEILQRLQTRPTEHPNASSVKNFSMIQIWYFKQLSLCHQTPNMKAIKIVEDMIPLLSKATRRNISSQKMTWLQAVHSSDAQPPQRSNEYLFHFNSISSQVKDWLTESFREVHTINSLTFKFKLEKIEKFQKSKK